MSGEIRDATPEGKSNVQYYDNDVSKGGDFVDLGGGPHIPEVEKPIGTLEILGLEQQTKRYIGGLEIVTVGWSICNSWIAVLVTLSLVLAQGGSVTLLYGILAVFVLYGCAVGTMAELASVFPSAGGQYHWTAILSPSKYSRGISYTCGIINVFAWIALSAGVAIIVAQGVLAIVIEYDTTYVPHPWHYFLIYQGISGLVILHNIFTLRHSMWMFNVAFALSLLSFFVVMITCLARSETKQSTDFVWTEFTNETGWTSKGVVFLIGLVAPNYMYSGIDGAIHLAEECTNAATAVPRALISTWIIGFVTTFVISIALLYSVQDFDTIVSTPTGFPVYELMIQATRSRTAGTIFFVIMISAGVVALVGAEQTSSRLTWAFARDNALIASKQIGHMNRRFEAPIWALLVNGLVILIIGCIYLGSSEAFNAFIGTGLILQLLSIAFPAALLLIRRRSTRFLPENRSFKLPSVVGWAANFFTVAFAIVTLVFYDFPTIRPVTSSNMNYASAVLGVMAIFGVLNWFVWARKRYNGPNLEFIETHFAG